MEKAAGHILKSNNVKLEGRFHLNAGQGGKCPTNERNAAVTSSQVCVVQSQPEFAVIEVTCSCGAKTLIRCDYPEG
jgi:hypothetical protein